MSILDNELIEDLNDQKLIEDFVKNFKIDHKKHIKPGVDCLGNKVDKGDIVLVISPDTITKTRLIPAIVIKHTKVKTQVISAFSYMQRKYGRIDGVYQYLGEVEKHPSFYPEQLVKIDLETAMKCKNIQQDNTPGDK